MEEEQEQPPSSIPLKIVDEQHGEFEEEHEHQHEEEEYDEEEEGEEEDDEEEQDDEDDQDEVHDAEDDSLTETITDVEEGKNLKDENQWEELPKMSHQGLRNVTAAGFGEIFNTTTKPIYSKMDLNRLVSTVAAAEVPPIFEAASLTPSEKFAQFEKIYGKLKTESINQPLTPVKDQKHRASSSSRASSAAASSGGVGATVADPLTDTIQSGFQVKTLFKTYLYRLVLIGSHKEDKERLIDWMKDIIEDINMHAYSETLTGIFVIYPNHFVHVLEGSEDTLMKYIRQIADQFEPTGYDWRLEVQAGHVSVRPPIIFETVKAVVVGMFQIKHRGIMNGWKAERIVSGLTMTAEQVPPGDFRERLFQFTRQVIIMAVALYKLNPLRPPPGISHSIALPSIAPEQVQPAPLPPVPENNNKIQITTPPPPPSSGDPSSTTMRAVGSIFSASAAEADELRVRYEDQRRRRAASVSQLVPKPAMIDYIMRKNEKRKLQLRTVREHIEYFWKIPAIIFDQQTEWPISGKIAPYD